MPYKNYYVAKSLQACMAMIIMVCSLASLLGQEAKAPENEPDIILPVDFIIKIQMNKKKPIKRTEQNFDSNILKIESVLNDPTSKFLKGISEGITTIELAAEDGTTETRIVRVLRQQSPATNLKFLKESTIGIEHLKKTINQVGNDPKKPGFPQKSELSVIPITTDSVLILGERDSKEDIKTILLLASKIVDPNYLEKEAGKIYEVDLQEDKDLLLPNNSGTTIQNVSSPGPVNMDKTSTKVSSKVINGIKFIKKESNFDFKLLQKTIKEVFPKSNIEVRLLTNDSVILMGYVSSAEDIPLILRIAISIVDPALGQAQSQISQGSSTSGSSNSLNSQNQQNGSNTTGSSTNPPSSPKVINTLRVAGVQQVQLDVVVAQVSRTEFRQLGFNFLSSRNSSFIGSTLTGLAIQPTAVGAGLASGASQGSTLAANGFVSSATAAANIPFGVLNSNSGFLGFLQALRNESASKLLAEPKLTTSSGKQATFLVGGEQAVLSGASGVNGPGADFKTVGTTLSFLPVVLGNGKIQLTVNPRVRSPNPALGITTSFGFVTGFDDKQVEATVEMETGQTFVIGGLIQNETRGSIVKVPVLGDLPFLGVLFSTKEYTETEQEVVVLVTPYLVDPQSCDQLPKLLPGQETRSPDDFELFLEGILEAPRGPRKMIQDRKYIPAFKNAKPLDAESGESRVPGNLIFPTRNLENPKPKELPIIETQTVPLPVPIPVPEISKSEKVSEAPPVQIKNSRSSLPIKVLPGVANPNNSESKIKTSSLQTLSPVK